MPQSGQPNCHLLCFSIHESIAPVASKLRPGRLVFNAFLFVGAYSPKGSRDDPAAETVADVKPVAFLEASTRGTAGGVGHQAIRNTVGSPCHETRGVQRIGHSKARHVRPENGVIGCLCRYGNVDCCIGQGRVR